MLQFGGIEVCDTFHEKKCDACMNKAQESNKCGGVAAKIMFSTVINLHILEFVVVVMRFQTESRK